MKTSEKYGVNLTRDSQRHASLVADVKSPENRNEDSVQIMYLLRSCYGVLGKRRSCAPSNAGMTQKRTGKVNPNTRSRIHIACWNTRTFFDTGTQCIFMRTFYFRGTNITRLSEVHPSKYGALCIQVLQMGASHQLQHSGPEVDS